MQPLRPDHPQGNRAQAGSRRHAAGRARLPGWPRNGIAMTIELALTLIILHAPGGLQFHVNPEHVASLHPPRITDPLVPRDAHCVIFTTDSKVLPVTETCDEVRAKLRAQE